MSRHLLLPGNHTLSHIAKCLALRAALEARGHEVHLAVSAARAPFLRRLGLTRAHVLPDLGDADHGAAPGFAWFRAPRVEACVRAELALLRRLRPDRVLGVFRFTGGLSARLAGIPYDALTCGAMTPACQEVLGFADDEPGATEQAAALAFFRAAGARRLAPALARLGLAPVDDLWRLLEGERTFLWDCPEFQPLPARPGYRHVGPLHWSGWPCNDHHAAALDRLRAPIAFLAFGTGGVAVPVLRRLVEALWQLGYAVALALGGQADATWPDAPERLAVFDFLPSDAVLPRAELVVCHGGQMLVFETLRRRLPVLVLPMQPEQAQNGRCLERMGCGRRLLRGMVFDGRPEQAPAAALARSPAALADTMVTFLAQPHTAERLARHAEALGRYGGADDLAHALETAQ